MKVLNQLTPLSEIMYQRDKDAFERRLLEGKLGVMMQRAQQGADLPATIQIANEVQEALRNGDRERANLLMQVHKTLDKGVLAYGNTPNAGGGDYGLDLPTENVTGQVTGQQALPPVFDGVIDPVEESRQAILRQQEQTGQVNPYQRPELTGVQYAPAAMPGYGQAVGSIAATKKGMETDAANASDDYWKPLTAAKVKEQTDAVERNTKLRSEVDDARKTIPIIEELQNLNDQSPTYAYADLQQPFRKAWPGTSPEEAAVDLMRQARLDLAAPLAKQLGVNPTDKDFQASLDRIFDISATKESRQQQINALKRRIENKAGYAKEQLGTAQGLYDRSRAQFEAARGGSGKVVNWEDIE